MRKKSKVKIFVLILGVIFLLSTIGNQNFGFEQGDNESSLDQGDNSSSVELRDETDLKSPKQSGYWDDIPFIHIDGNWSIAAGEEWCNGDGSWYNPYIIENVTMDASSSPTGSGIFINNSKNEYFIIRNCTVYDAGSGTYDGGIRLDNTNNGTLTINNCSDNGRAGIILLYDCDNNTISGNTASNNEDYGVWIADDCNNNTISGNTASNDGTTLQNVGIYLNLDCDNNTISENTANNNMVLGIQLDNGCDNNTISGNTANDNGGLSVNDSGLYLDDCDGNTISGNIASDNDDYGIYLDNCDNNTVSGNLIKNNQDNGIRIEGGDSRNNLIFQNSLIGTIGSHAWDTGANNHWNTSVVGNYWDNHTSPDSNNDGIVDTPYIWITGGANSEDGYPLAENPVHLGEKIHIDDSGVNAWNWSKTAKLKAWCTGSGSDSDPYVIDGLEINGGSSGSCIIIEDSGVNFTIQNCKVYNGGDGGFDGGIKLENTNNGTLTNNICSDNDNVGIILLNDCCNNTISGNIANNNQLYGIYLRNDCVNNTLSGNIANQNIGEFGLRLSGVGIYLENNCDNNTILGNNVNDNNEEGRGIVLDQYCSNNTISGNTANNNKGYGIFIENDCDDNIILGNTVNGNYLYGILLYEDCDNNNISGNTANNNFYIGISLIENCDNNTISGNSASNNGTLNQDKGIYIRTDCDDNTISGNTANNNKGYGIFLVDNCDNNNITENYLYFNTDGAIRLYCDNTLIKMNGLVSSNAKFIHSSGTNTIIDYNYFGMTPPSFVIEVIAQSFSTTEFVVTINVSSQFIGLEVSALSIQMWWDETAVPSNDITDLGNGLYNISLTPIFVEPGDDPILLNIVISATHHLDKYFEMDLAVDPAAVGKDGDGGDDGDNGDDDDDDDDKKKKKAKPKVKEPDILDVLTSPVGIIVLGLSASGAVAGVASYILLKKRKLRLTGKAEQ